MPGDEQSKGAGHPWWRPWLILVVAATVVTMSIGLLIGLAAVVLGAEVRWLDVVGVSALVLGFEVALFAVLALMGRHLLQSVERSVERHRALFDDRP